MSALTAYDELGKSFDLELEAGETYLKFATRAARELKKIKDEDWYAMSEELQLWHRNMLLAMEGREPYPTLAGMPDIEEPAGPEEEAASEGELDAPRQEDSDEESDDDNGSEPDDGDEPPEDDDALEQDTSGEEAGAAEEPEGGRLPRARKKPALTRYKPAKRPPIPHARPGRPPTPHARPGRPLKVVTRGKGRPPLFASNAKIKILVRGNPHRKGTNRYKRWGKYRSGMTVAEALKAGLSRGTLRYSVLDGHIEIK